MKRLACLVLLLSVFSFFAAPAWAQRGSGKGKGQSAAPQSKEEKSDASMSEERSNKGGEIRGTERAEEVHEMKTEGKAEPRGKEGEHDAKAKKQKKGKGDKDVHGKGKD